MKEAAVYATAMEARGGHPGTWAENEKQTVVREEEWEVTGGKVLTAL